MRVPFTLEEFLALFASYNEALWPAPLALSLLAVGAAAAVLLQSGRGWSVANPQQTTGRLVSGALALLALWTGMAYHWAFFTRINPAAWLFGAMFVLEGVLLAWHGVARGAIAFRVRPDLRGLAGGAVMLYALVVYPLIGAQLGHRFPAAPTFGAPCPTTLFLFGMLLWSDPFVVTRRRIAALLVVPLLWAAIGMSAAMSLSMRQDLALPIVAIGAGVLLLMPARKAPHARRMPAAAAMRR
jgi:hypothetical protein